VPLHGIFLLTIYIKVKVTLWHAYAGTDGGSGGSIAPTHSQPWHYKGVSGQHHALVTLPWERPSTHCTGGWEGLSLCLDGHGKSHPHQHSIPGLSSL